MKVESIPVDLIVLPPYMHRVSIDQDKLNQLAASIAEHGPLQPIVVEQLGDHYLLRAGHRRLLAHIQLGRDTIAANIREPGDTTHGEALTWIENLQREDLSPMEEARALHRAHTEHRLTIDTLADQLKRRPEWIAQRLSLVALPDNLATLVHTRELPISHALLLAEITDDQHRDYLTTYAKNAGVSTTILREWVRAWATARDAGDGAAAPRPAIPEPGQPIVITMPCYSCGNTHPVTALRIVRVCPQCARALADLTTTET